MTREAQRRGFSRRIQYTLFAGYVLAAAGIAVALLLVIAQRISPRMFDAVEAAALDVTAPVTGAARSVVRGFDGMIGDVGDYVAAGRQNRLLKAELARARVEIVRARVLEYDNGRLRRLSRLAAADPRPVAIARIVGSTPTSQRRTATLAAGGGEGVRPGMPVRAPEGLIGLVSETGRRAARVLLITDGASTVPILVARSGQPGLASGRGDGTLDARVVLGGGTPFRLGDLLITSGTGGIYPPGIPVALIVSVDRDAAVARPLADPARLDYAAVEPAFGPVLPPPPIPPSASKPPKP